jgi:DNA/RNA-binding domain of Phe-tRNA-synthetase-like protein
VTPTDGEIARGTIALELSDEFPGLQLVYATVPVRLRRTPRVVKARLAEMSDRFRVAQAPSLRQSGVPSAYRAFYRQVGVDPDVVRTPLDEAIFLRLMEGSFRSHGHLQDAIAIAALETHVPIWCMDAAGLVGGLGVRGAEEGEVVAGPDGRLELTPGQLVIADATGPVVALLAPAGDVRRATKRSEHIVLYCLQVPGVPALTVLEALRVCGAMLSEY